MDLWIRSQNRLKLVEVKEIYVIDIFKATQHYPETIRNYEYINIESNNIVLGKYKTKERALEVLDEIQSYLIPKVEYLGNKDLLGNDCKFYDINNIQTLVYEMPEE